MHFDPQKGFLSEFYVKVKINKYEKVEQHFE